VDVGALGFGSALVVGAADSPLPEAGVVGSEAAAPAAVPPSPDDEDGFTEERASTFAQPLPLKWIAGALSALRIAPPQASQADGPVASIPWTTSTRRPHSVQTYS
jgi:hypothetical protein